MVCGSDLRADRIPRFFSVAYELLRTVVDEEKNYCMSLFVRLTLILILILGVHFNPYNTVVVWIINGDKFTLTYQTSPDEFSGADIS